MSFAFPSWKRLHQSGVMAILKRGKRLNCDDFELKFLVSVDANAAGDGKIAISIPKRLLKASVARNRLKRLVREEYRRHGIASAPLHLLVNYKARGDGRHSAVRRQLRLKLVGLFDQAALRAEAMSAGARAA